MDDSPPSLELIVPIARKLSGSCEEQSGVQHLAILAFWYLLIGVVQRKRLVFTIYGYDLALYFGYIICRLFLTCDSLFLVLLLIFILCILICVL